MVPKVISKGEFLVLTYEKIEKELRAKREASDIMWKLEDELRFLTEFSSDLPDLPESYYQVLVLSAEWLKHQFKIGVSLFPNTNDTHFDKYYCRVWSFKSSGLSLSASIHFSILAKSGGGGRQLYPPFRFRHSYYGSSIYPLILTPHCSY